MSTPIAVWLDLLAHVRDIWDSLRPPDTAGVMTEHGGEEFSDVEPTMFLDMQLAVQLDQHVHRLRDLLENEELREAKRQIALGSATTLTWDVTVNRTIELYEQITTHSTPNVD